MLAIDNWLARKDLSPFQRPLHIGLLLSDALAWEGCALPSKELADEPGFTGDHLLAKAFKWYEQVYGDELKTDWAIGYIPIKIFNNLWKVRLPIFYGSCNFFVDRNLHNKGILGGGINKEVSVNVLSLIEHIPPGLVVRLSENEAGDIFETIMWAINTFYWWHSLRGHIYFDVARNDFSSSTDEILKGSYGQSKWGAAQAVEKTLKGFLALRHLETPRGPEGHNLVKLGNILNEKLNIKVNPKALEFAKCSPGARYGEETTTQDQALIANFAVIEIISELSTSPQVATILARASNNPDSE